MGHQAVPGRWTSTNRAFKMRPADLTLSTLECHNISKYAIFIIIYPYLRCFDMETYENQEIPGAVVQAV